MNQINRLNFVSLNMKGLGQLASGEQPSFVRLAPSENGSTRTLTSSGLICNEAPSQLNQIDRLIAKFADPALNKI